jgi:Ca2+-binding EF-hand superfamily protein
MFDRDGNGYIELEQLESIISELHTLTTLKSISGRLCSSVEDFAQEFFDDMDTDGDGRVSLAEFMQGAMRNPDIIKGLMLFPDVD